MIRERLFRERPTWGWPSLPRPLRERPFRPSVSSGPLFPGGMVRRVREAPVLWAGAFVVLELGLLYLASHERYVPLTHATNADGLRLLHEFSQVLAVALVGVIGLVAWRGLGASRRASRRADPGTDLGAEPGSEPEAGPEFGSSSGPGSGVGSWRAPPAARGRDWIRPAVVRARAGLWGGHLAALVALLALYPVLPRWPGLGPHLGAWETGVLGAMVVVFLVFLVTALLLVAPVALRRDWTSALSLAGVALGLVVATAAAGAAGGTWVTVAAIRRPIEEATLALSLAFYDLTGLAPAEVLLGGADPVLLAEGYAIILAPVCSGYQGLFSAAALLGGYLALERRSLRPGRAAVLAFLALGAVFVMNAARIALLFALGVSGWPGIAENGFHSYFGVVTLLVVVGLAILALEGAAFRRGRPVSGGHPERNSVPRGDPGGSACGPGGTTAGTRRERAAGMRRADELERIGRCLLPLAGLMAAGLVTGLAAGPVHWLYPVSLAVGAGLLWVVRDVLAAELGPGGARAGAGGRGRAGGQAGGRTEDWAEDWAADRDRNCDGGRAAAEGQERSGPSGLSSGPGATQAAGQAVERPVGLRRRPVAGPSVAGFLCGGLVFGLWVVLVPPDPGAAAPVVAALAAAPLPLAAGWVLMRLIGASVVVPLVEELAFRAGLMRLLGAVVGDAPGLGTGMRAGIAVGGSALAFGLLHAEILAGTLAGLVYGALVVWRGSLWDAILAHAVTNFLLALTVLSLGHWSYW